MKRFTEAVCLIAMVLVLAGLSAGQSEVTPPLVVQTGDVFVAIGGLESEGQVQWYRNGALLTTLDTGQANTFAAGMAFDAAGNLYVTVFNAANVIRFDRNGNRLGSFGSGYSVDGISNDPESILFDSGGNAYVGQADGTHQVRKFDSSGNFLAAFSPKTEDRGTDWIDLAADQKTLYYASEGTHVKRFDLSTNTQLSDLNSIPLLGAFAYALRILNDGSVLVADTDRVVHLNSSGAVMQTYLASDIEPETAPALFALSLDPDGTSFWTGDLNAGTVWKIDIASGAILTTIGTGITTGQNLGGVLVFGEPTQTKQTVSIHLGFGATSSATAAFLTNNDLTNPASHAMSVTTNVTNPNGIDVLITANYVPTEISSGTTGKNINDGICEGGQRPTNDADLDCRLAAGGFVYQTLPNGDQVVPHCSPYHNNMCVWYRVTTTSLAADQVSTGYDYIGPVYEKMGWNTNLLLATPSPNPEYAPGWNNQNARLYDRHGDDPLNFFKFDVTDYYSVTCDLASGCAFPELLPGDQSGGGHTTRFNDFVWADAPNPPTGKADEVETVVPLPGTSPFPYVSTAPMLVAFELERVGTEITDPSALTKPHSVNVATLDATGVPIPVQFPLRFPQTFTFNPFLKVYYIFLSPAPYKLSDGTPNTVYTLQIGSDLFAQPVTKKFKLCTVSQILNRKCP
ncbi:MAG: hypothetical protein DMG82_25665 [Acidobacteria bacterium]|nr:MAG: hypothetical protein DMG82_25665 [Acidobacteriota bacterium]